MNFEALKERVQARDRLLQQAQNVEQQLNQDVLGAFARGELAAAEAAARGHEAQLRELTENLRIYQAELHAQADELVASQTRNAHLLDRFTALFSSLPVAALLVAHNGEVLEHNTLATRSLQMRLRPIGSRFLHRLVDSDQFQVSVRPAFLQAQAEGTSRVDNLVFVGEQGQRFVGELHIARLPGRNESDCIFACAIVDRTEHLRDLNALQAAADSLRRSESFLSDAARVARTGGWELTLRPRALRLSAQLLELLEIEDPQVATHSATPSGKDSTKHSTKQSATLETLLSHCANHDRAVLATALAAAEQGLPFETELDMHSASGRVLRVQAVGHAEREGPHLVRVHGVLQDITHQHLVRRQLGDLSERLAIANDAGGIGVWDSDLVQGQLVFDARLCQMLGLAATPKGTLVDALRPLLLPDSLAKLELALHGAVQRLEPLNLELRLLDETAPAACAERWFHFSGRAHADGRGQATRLVGCAWDSSPQHEALRLLAAKDAAEKASQAKSAFLSRVSHELRTPLNAILGFSQLMRMEAEAGDLVLKPHRVTLIESAARHLLELVNEVLDVSRIEAGRLEVRLTPFEMGPVIAEALPMVQGLADAAGVQLQVQLVPAADSAAPVQVVGDRLRLKEVLINLLSNAIKYNVPSGQVRVSVGLQADQVLVQVQDTGRGLSEQQLADLFQPFNRVGAESSGIEGSGMGLFVSQRFVELMGGRIEVQSQLGAGTTVSLSLPVPTPAAA